MHTDVLDANMSTFYHIVHRAINAREIALIFGKVKNNMTEKDLAEDYRMVLHEAESMGCNKIKALYNIPLKNMEMIVQALEKQIPKKVKIEQWIYTKCDCGFEFSKHHGDGYYSIPLENKTKYCPNCGQKLDWGEEE